MKKIFILFIVLCIPFLVNAQGTSTNHSKYWFYRYRMVNEFMVKGVEPCGEASGLSIPSAGAYRGAPLDNAGADSITRRLGDVPETGLHYGDGSSFLGYYIGVLATEHKLLIDHGGHSTQIAKNEEELYFAMLAFERLDRNAEKLIAPKASLDCNNNLNGFFLRDDVPVSIADKLKRPYTLTDPSKKRTIKSDYEENKGRDISDLTGSGEGQAFASQDQIADMFVGLSLVRKLMAGYNYNGYDFSVKAAENTSRIMDRLWGDNYQIKVPNNGGIVKFGGVEVQANAYAIAKAAQRIADNKWGKVTFPSGRWENATTQLSLANVWSRVNLPEGLAMYQYNWDHNEYNNGILSTLAAIGDSWEVGLVANRIVNSSFEVPFPCTSIKWDLCNEACLFGRCVKVCRPRLVVWDCPKTIPIEVWCYSNTLATVMSDAALASIAVTQVPTLGVLAGPALALALQVVPNIYLCAPFRLPNITINTTSLALTEYGWRYNTQLFPILHKVLHNEGPYNYTNSSIVDIMNSAPCSGPHYKPVDDPYTQSNSEGAYGWYGDNRFQKGNFEARKNDNKQGANLGLDYMLLHNLYLLANGSSNDFSQIGQNMNKMNIVVENKNYSNTSVYLKAMESIETFNTVTVASGNVIYMAGDLITFRPGFTVNTSANFTARLGLDLNCGNGTASVTTPQNIAAQNAPANSVPFDVAGYNSYLAKAIKQDLGDYPIKLQELEKKNAYEPLDLYVSKTSTDAVASAIKMSVYPNPSKEQLNLQLLLPQSQIVELEVRNELGASVLRKMSELASSGVYDKTISISALPTGMYYLFVKTNEGVKVNKFIKQ